jgi:hypothetical protein
MAYGEFDLNYGMDRVDLMFFGGLDSLVSSPIFGFYTETYGMGDVATGGSDPTTLQEDMYHTTAGDLDNPLAAALEAQREARIKRVRKPRDKTQPVSLGDIFAVFHSSKDIPHQPSSPQHNLCGLDLVEQLISELELALRLSELHDRWRKMRRTKYLKDVDVLVGLKNKGRTIPWGPLSDSLTLYELDLQDTIDKHGHNAELDWQAKRKVKVDKALLAKSVKADLRQKASELTEKNIAALLELFVNEFGHVHSENRVKNELNRQLRMMKGAIAEDCVGLMRFRG